MKVTRFRELGDDKDSLGKRAKGRIGDVGVDSEETMLGFGDLCAWKREVCFSIGQEHINDDDDDGEGSGCADH